jgi:hypothetical protein
MSKVARHTLFWADVIRQAVRYRLGHVLLARVAARSGAGSYRDDAGGAIVSALPTSGCTRTCRTTLRTDPPGLGWAG